MSTERKSPVGIYIVAILGTFLLMALLVNSVIERTAPAPIDAARAAERAKALAEVRAADAVALSDYGWADPNRGIVRLPIEVAKKLALEMSKDPKAARTNLLFRSDLRTRVLKNEYE